MAAAGVNLRRNFDPSEKDLVNYLWLKLNGQTIPIPSNEFIPEIDIYGQLKPWEMFDRNESARFYAFAWLKSRGGQRFRRSAGGGTWELKNSTLFAEDGRFLKRNLVYEYKDKRKDEVITGQWSMVEFSLQGAADKDFVVCKVRFNHCRKQSRHSRHGGRRGNVAGLSPAVGGLRIMERAAVVVEEEELDEGDLGSESPELVVAAEAGEVKIRAEELGKLHEFDFDLESKEEILALTENFWSQPPGNIWETVSWNDTFITSCLYS